jgi:hypothetical protein
MWKGRRHEDKLGQAERFSYFRRELLVCPVCPRVSPENVKIPTLTSQNQSEVGIGLLPRR